MKQLEKSLPLTFSILLISSSAFAVTEKVTDGEKIDYLVPDSPAMHLIGVSVDDTLRPQSPKALVTDIRSAFDDNGKLKNAISLAFVPYLLLEGDQLTLTEYRDDWWTRALTNMELSFVGARGESTNDADRYSAGFRWNVFDHGDPRDQSSECLAALRDTIGIRLEAMADAGLAQMDEGPAKEKIIAVAEKAVRAEKLEQCDRVWARDYWNAQALDISLAYAWANGGTSLTGLEDTSYGAYASWSFPVSGKDGQVITHARYTIDQLAVSNAGSFFNQDAGYVGARWRHKLGDRSAINLEAGYTFTDPDNMPSDSYTQYGVSFEYRISENVWLTASTGGRSNADNEDDDVRGLAAFKWNLANAASIFD